MLHPRIGKLLRLTAIAFILYIVISCLVPPLFHREVSEEYKQADAGMAPAAMDCERVLGIDDNTDALIWRLRAIETAREEIALTTYDFGDDNSGRDMMAALLQAADRGVKVKIIVDGINGFISLSGSRHFKALVSDPNVEAKLYNPINLLTPWRVNYRMHDKYLIADDMIYILGGRNTNDLFLGDHTDKYNVDRDVLVYQATPDAGNSLPQLQRYFQSIWALPDCKEYTNAGNSKKVAAAKEDLKLRYENLKTTYPQAFGTTDWVQETFPAKSIRLLSNSITTDNKAPELWYSIWQMAQKSRDIVIQTPYIACNDDMYAQLSTLDSDEKRLRILTNAVENGANPFGCTDYLNQKAKILQTGAEVYEYLGGQSLHTKTILLDQNISIIGSLNLDMRSVYLNTETMLVIDCPQLNQQFSKAFEATAEFSKHVLPDGSSTQGSQYEEVSLTGVQRIVYGVLRVLLVPFRHLL